MKFTLDTTLGEILDNPQAKAVLDQYLPGVADNPMVGMVKGLTLNNLLAMPQAAQLGITKDKVQKILDDVNARIA
jgi:hypothetical protein